MSMYIPVYYGPMDPSEFTPGIDPDEIWMGIEKGRWPQRSSWLPRSTVSRNWWLQHMLHRLATVLKIRGLEFNAFEDNGDSKLTVLEGAQIETASSSLDQFIRHCRIELPLLEGERDQYLNEVTSALESDTYELAPIRERLDLSDDASPDSDWPHDRCVHFCSYVKSLAEALSEAKEYRSAFFFSLFSG